MKSTPKNINKKEYPSEKMNLLIKAFLLLGTTLGLLCTLFSTGWMQMTYWWVFLPVYLFHLWLIQASITVLHRTRRLAVLSTFYFLAFSLIRTDYDDDPGIYSGYSVVLYLLGFREDSRTNLDVNPSLMFALLAILFIIDIILALKIAKVTKAQE